MRELTKIRMTVKRWLTGWLSGFYCGGAVILGLTAYSFEPDVGTALWAGLVWPYLVARFILFLVAGVELP